MLSRRARLTKKSDFDRVFRHGRAFFMGPLGVKVLATGAPVQRFGFVVGTVVSKRAVVRNRIKRRLRDMTRRLLPDMPQGIDVVVVTRIGAETLTARELVETYRTLLTRARLIARTP